MISSKKINEWKSAFVIKERKKENHIWKTEDAQQKSK